MAGKAKYAQKMGEHLGEPIDGSCPIAHAGGTGAQMGGLVGSIVSGAVSSKQSDVSVPTYAWLGVGPDGFAITASSAMGKPKGDPILRATYAEVTGAGTTDGKITVRVDIELTDGRHLAFEAKRHGQNKANVEVIDLLLARCA